MRLTVSPRFEQFGSVQIHETQRVIELDAGSGCSTASSLTVSRDALLAIESKMAIIILCMNEEFKTLESVFSGIPHDCFIILVSNSSRSRVDKYQTEVSILQAFCRNTDRSAIAIHQKDPGAAKAFNAAGVPDLIATDGLVHSGKGEGMVMGMALAALMDREYIGFIDADNYIPGSILEYCKAYAAGFHLAKVEDAMIRVSWSSKPKERNGRLMFDRKGRSSRVVNEWLNKLLQEFSGYGTDCITTGNAGEHAMTMSLAKKLRMAGGFAVEPYQYLFLLEQLGGQLEQKVEEDFLSQTSEIHILQVETRNPHLHDNKGDEHVSGMRAQALNMLYHSKIVPDLMKATLLKWMEDEKLLERGHTPPTERVYPSIDSLNMNSLRDILSKEAESLKTLSCHEAIDGPFSNFIG
ncbi:mannosyl-3-phosphoglycerate synthase [Truncatella angustata]|uniref:Mannosyl-3-phosphoglycerate synthase n=1 Tax=Truncatella angustata TaxID=152316 RepID=A0A9P8RNU0_9PEZI|nr:mannosyl-3-phosphoglycerate synthase [Truncatella angustata]KAH6646890.1 mannosyl-3-phosphoglycerate synthase [Truncatella angustata]